MHAASALRSLPVASAKARKVRAVSLVTSAIDGASSALAIGRVPASPRTMLAPRPPNMALRIRWGCVRARNAVTRAPIE